MSDFIVRTSAQLPALLHAFRKQEGLTQAEAALRLGVTQQTMSALERNAEKVSAERLMKLLGILGVELVLRKVDPLGIEPSASADLPGQPAGPAW
ncbi:helix-turn-helix transcriptional regulator [Variovorax ginsengisoli]|uniref:HTH-type transcriptional regulator/antitoxin HipB n=1 Tax=Variovorax ginsengisoli TaxID=363844 RepID=A0ABT9SBR8_9BURK|nr:helix-turn-helix transcriptional regulator [Variovorax ginsengisoli]MDP9900842.1 HTH-type transcriptional regulator/antitoxin HipB [Variovorax ginsengisoli]